MSERRVPPAGFFAWGGPPRRRESLPPGRTRQACAFAGAYDGFQRKEAVVSGVSRDSAASHDKFAKKYERPDLAYCTAKEYADGHGIKIYNATRGGKLEVFERRNFDELFPV